MPEGRDAPIRGSCRPLWFLLIRQRLQIVRYIHDVLAGEIVGHGLHDSALRPLVGSLKNGQLLDQIVGVLPGEAREGCIALALRPMATGARRNALVGDTASENGLAGFDPLRVALDRLALRLLR